MTPKLARMTAKELVDLLKRRGFELSRSKGSHQHFFNSVSKIRVTVPVHSGRIIGLGLLRAILKQANISPCELVK